MTIKEYAEKGTRYFFVKNEVGEPSTKTGRHLISLNRGPYNLPMINATGVEGGLYRITQFKQNSEELILLPDQKPEQAEEVKENIFAKRLRESRERRAKEELQLCEKCNEPPAFEVPLSTTKDEVIDSLLTYGVAITKTDPNIPFPGLIEEMRKVQVPNYYPGIEYQELFNYMHNEHGVTLLQSDMDEIIMIVRKFLETNPKQY